MPGSGSTPRPFNLLQCRQVQAGPRSRCCMQYYVRPEAGARPLPYQRGGRGGLCRVREGRDRDAAKGLRDPAGGRLPDHARLYTVPRARRGQDRERSPRQPCARPRDRYGVDRPARPSDGDAVRDPERDRADRPPHRGRGRRRGPAPLPETGWDRARSRRRGTAGRDSARGDGNLARDRARPGLEPERGDGGNLRPKVPAVRDPGGHARADRRLRPSGHHHAFTRAPRDGCLGPRRHPYQCDRRGRAGQAGARPGAPPPGLGLRRRPSAGRPLRRDQRPDRGRPVLDRPDRRHHRRCRHRSRQGGGRTTRSRSSTRPASLSRTSRSPGWRSGRHSPESGWSSPRSGSPRRRAPPPTQGGSRAGRTSARPARGRPGPSCRCRTG